MLAYQWLRPKTWACCWLVAGCMVAILPVKAALGSVDVSSIRVGQHEEYTRFVLDMSDDVQPRVFTLADPYRVVIDLPEVKWKFEAAESEAKKGLVAGYRFGLFKPGNSRVVLDLTGPSEIARVFNLKPDGPKGYRLVLDLKTIGRDAFLASAGWPSSSNDAAVPSLPLDDPRTRTGKYVVVIDPGHGGIDPGARGRSGILEKNISLAVGKQVSKSLKGRGRYEVVMTRDDDIFHSLKDRVAIARAERADLFISLHADTIRDRSVRGASVYTLSETASDSEAGELALKENQADVIAGVDFRHENADVSMILIELSQRETMNRSVQFAQVLMPELSQETRLLRNTHRFAGFRVLKAPDVPSVLLELGYLSNRQDEKNLGSLNWRKKVAGAIADSVDQHFESEEKGGLHVNRQAALR